VIEEAMIERAVLVTSLCWPCMHTAGPTRLSFVGETGVDLSLFTCFPSKAVCRWDGVDRQGGAFFCCWPSNISVPRRTLRLMPRLREYWHGQSLESVQ